MNPESNQKNMAKLFCLVVEPTHFEKICSSNWIIFPNHQGENSNKKKQVKPAPSFFHWIFPQDSRGLYYDRFTKKQAAVA